MPEHHHAHGPANRGRVVLTTAAPLFICEPVAGPATEAVIAVHGAHGITVEFERGLRAMAACGYLIAAPFHYFRDGGQEYLTVNAALEAHAALIDEDVDADVDAAIEHVASRSGLRPAAVVGAAPAAVEAVRRAGRRHPDLLAVTSFDEFWEITSRRAFPA